MSDLPATGRNTHQQLRRGLLCLLAVSLLAIPLMLVNWSGQAGSGLFHFTGNRLATAALPLLAAVLAGAVFGWTTSKPRSARMVRVIERHQVGVYQSFLAIFIVAAIFLAYSSAVRSSPLYYYYLNLKPLALYLIAACAISLFFLARIVAPAKSDRFAIAASCALALAACIRVLHLLYIDINLPYSLGGLFLEFSRQILAADFRMPAWIPFYTEGGLPFVYPPLAFYTEAILLRVLPLSDYAIVNLLPVAFTLATLPLFYRLVRDWGFSPIEQVAALVAFCFFPAAFHEQKDSAGLAEALGTVGLILFYIAALRFWRSPQRKAAIVFGAALGFCVLSSPGSAYLASLLSAGIFLFAIGKRDAQRAKGLMIAGLVGVLVSSPYWAPVMLNHGPLTFWESIEGQSRSAAVTLDEHVRELRFVASKQPALWGTLTLLGVVEAFRKRQYILLGLFLVCLATPREGIWMASIPAAMIAGLSLLYVSRLAARLAQRVARSERGRAAVQYALAGLFLFTATGLAALDSLELVRSYNREYYWRPAVQAMQWASQHLPRDAQMMSPGVPSALADDWAKEWTPTISQRTTLDVIYGTEFKHRAVGQVQHYQSAQDCETLECLRGILSTAVVPTQVYLLTTQQWLRKLAGDPADYESVYDVDGIVIFHFSN